MRIESGKFYKTRDGRKVGPMARFASGNRYWAAPTALDGYGSYWCENGKFHEGEAWSVDLVAEWSDEGPIRTVTRREIVEGEYGGIHVVPHVSGHVLLGFEVGGDVHLRSFNAEQLAELEHLSAQLREALADASN